MDIVGNNFMPGDPRLIQQLVYELKSQGIFDQFRKECIADVDTKPAYQNLRQRVEGSVTTFLQQQTWSPELNKNQVREQLRKNIYESGYLEIGVERIVDQVVNPKINTVFLPQVEDVVYRYLGVQKPTKEEPKQTQKVEITDLLPTDLEAISPGSVHSEPEPAQEQNESADDSMNNSTLNSSKMEDEESPPFEPLEVPTNPAVVNEENSMDSHMSGFSGLHSHDSNSATKAMQIDLSNQDSQISQNSSESRLSIVISEDTKMEVDSEPKTMKSSDSESKTEASNEDSKGEKKHQSRKHDKKHDDKKKDKREEKKSKDDKHSSKSSDKHSSKNKEKEKERERSSSKHSKHGKSDKKDRKDDKKDKKDYKNKSDGDKREHKSRSESDKKDHKLKEESDKKKDTDKGKHHKSKDPDKEKSDKHKKREKDEKHKDSGSKERCDKKKEAEGDKSEKYKEKDKNSSSKDKSKDRDKSRSDHDDPSKSKHKKEKKRDKSKDDHYSLKDKKQDRRSTDRDPNDGKTGNTNHCVIENNISSSQKTNNSSSSQDTTSSSGGNNSGNSDTVDDQTVPESQETTKTKEEETSKVKYIKPKFASNLKEAMRIMKIRKQLAKLERKNQLSLADITVPVVNGIEVDRKGDDESLTNEETEPDFILKSKELSKESWEALEARLAEEMSNVDYSAYDDDDYDYSESAIVISPQKTEKPENTQTAIEEENDDVVQLEPNETEAMMKVEEETENPETVEQIIEENVVECDTVVIDVSEVVTEEIVSEENILTIDSEEKENVTVEPNVSTDINDHKDEIEMKVMQGSSSFGSDDTNNVDLDSECRYLDTLPPYLKDSLENLYKLIKKLEGEVEHGVKTCHNNFAPLVSLKGRKRKLEETSEVKNNNQNRNCQDSATPMESKKRGRPPGSNAKANRNKLIASYEVVALDRFPLPPSPAESDTSLEKKEDDLAKPTKQRKLADRDNMLSPTDIVVPKQKRQRYSSEDLYKPRPTFTSTRRSRGTKAN